MTPEDQRIAIAEFCGWQQMEKKCGRTPDEDFFVGKRFIVRFGELSRELPLPDYCNSLEAIATAEALLSVMQRQLYCQELDRLTARATSWDHTCWRLLSATAAQRCQALLRTIGKWSDVEPDLAAVMKMGGV